MSLLLNKSWLVQRELLAPVDTTSESSSEPLTKSETIELLGEDDVGDKPLEIDEEKEDKEDKKSKEDEDEDEDKKDGDEDELTELTDEIEEPTEEQLELATPVRRQEILKKYPNVFKDFPYLEKAYFREQQFTELLPTIDDAKLAVEKSNALDKFELDLMNGSTEKVLFGVKNSDEEAWNKLVDNYLPTLSRVDTKAYHHVIGNVIKHTIKSMVSESRLSQNETLQAAAQILNQFVFGTSEYTAPSQLSKDSPKDDSRINDREKQFVQRQFESTRDELNTRVNSVLKSTIEAHIDPSKSMSDYIKKNASRETIESLTRLIDTDTRFRTLLDRLWEQAFKNDFSRDSVDKIKSAYLSKAQTLLPSVIKKARSEALKGLGKRTNSEDVKLEILDTSKESKSSKTSSSNNNERPNSGKIKSAKDIPRNMKTLDFLMQD